MGVLSSVSAFVLCISCILATTTNAFILVGRNGVGRGESLKGPQTVEESLHANDITNSVSKYFGSSSSSSSKDLGHSNATVADNRVAKCRFTAGTNELSKDEQLPSFYIPSKDKELYESGVRELLSQVTDEKVDAKSNKAVAAKMPNIALQCEDVTQSINSINCRLCMYNEISKDKKHLRQGQVLDVLLDACIFGSFGNNMNVLRDSNNNHVSDYHPICYPPSTSSNSSGGATRNRFRKTADNGNKYEAPVDIEEVAYFVGKALQNADESNYILDNDAVVPDELVLNMLLAAETIGPLELLSDVSGHLEPYFLEVSDGNAQDGANYDAETKYDENYGENNAQYFVIDGENSVPNYYADDNQKVPAASTEKQNNSEANIVQYFDDTAAVPDTTKVLYLLDGSQVVSAGELLNTQY